MPVAALRQLRPQLGQDQQAAVGPPPALDHERAEVRRGGAVAEPLGVVGQRPAVRPEVDAGLGIFDDRPVLDVGADLEAADGLHLDDVVQRVLADHGVGAHPEGGPVVGHALVQDVLEVGGGAGDPFDPGGGAAEGGVRRLGDRDALVARGLQEVDQPQAVVAQQLGVGVQRQQVGRCPGHPGSLACGSAGTCRRTMSSAASSAASGGPSGRCRSSGSSPCWPRARGSRSACARTSRSRTLKIRTSRRCSSSIRWHRGPARHCAAAASSASSTSRSSRASPIRTRSTKNSSTWSSMRFGLGEFLQPDRRQRSYSAISRCRSDRTARRSPAAERGQGGAGTAGGRRQPAR